MNKKRSILWLGIFLLVALGIVMTGVRFTKTPEPVSAGQWKDMDLASLTEFQSPYIGDAANVSQLFYRLPLGDFAMQFSIDDEACMLTVAYEDPGRDYDDVNLKRNLAFNAVAAMALIDNLACVKYDFPSKSYTVLRETPESLLGAPLSNLLTSEEWQKKVAEPLREDAFVAKFF